MEEKIYTEDTCCVCLEKLGRANTITFRCGHMCMHASCFISTRLNTCPMCRERIVDDPNPPVPIPVPAPVLPVLPDPPLVPRPAFHNPFVLEWIGQQHLPALPDPAPFASVALARGNREILEYEIERQLAEQRIRRSQERTEQNRIAESARQQRQAQLQEQRLQKIIDICIAL
jgi:Zinc finger, C3HC4 type (RING finger)